ncbi:3-[(3aS,4S,7aS)-7a-methyl-1,5-dioxo-octahydro-1H-inden-4-yl]propanoyl:CoA ligase-like [Eupeodes corollae]|uniref:3-[(3aS,4S,7aS)-7a-methyl-1, 5-dioxo-octahydro-1H-inden-4-yl]propanoyl:CoA ligase-like n=1 Tax=Eupeodes corollae TaxID=290404 RepID=UPI0024937E95|nr:3-[(3aS,4S,7aS)-7a-methyl-1,5-dioxo-octahydro-1H-inden-4-yl]propanoyl:CoA ligase-like [Eupeodes corollae]
MGTQYIESEKLWRSEKLNINFKNLGQTILEKLAECCEKNPNRVLEVYHENGIQLTVKDIYLQTIIVAQNLLKLGVKTGDRVIFFSRTNEKVTPIVFACYAIGAAINFFDIHFEDDATIYTIEQIDPVMILYEEDFKAKISKTIECGRLSQLKHALSLNSTNSSVDEVLFKSIGVNAEHFQPPDLGDPFKLPAILAFTSGTTGMPKLSIHSQAMVLQGLYNGWWHLWPGSVVCIFSDLRWICQIEIMLQPVFYDVKRVFCYKQEKAISSKLQFDIIHIHGITHCYAMPMILLDMLNYLEQLEDTSCFECMKSLLLVGEVVSDAMVMKSNKILPHCKIIQCYGMTELPGMVASNEFVSPPNSNRMMLKNGFSVKIIDEDGKSLGPNEKGRLLFKADDAPILGYFKNENANKLAFTEGGWFDTHDYAIIDEHNLLTVITRERFLIKSSGITIIPKDIEDIVNSHETVYTCALIGHPNPAKLNDQMGTVFVVFKNNISVEKSNKIESELKQILKIKLTKNQLGIVKYLKVLPSMPLTKCCKTNRKILIELASKMSSKYILG